MTVGEMQSCKNSIDEVTLLRMQNSRKALLSFSAEHTQGKTLLEIIVRISLTTLISYAGEKDLQVPNATSFLIHLEFHACFLYIQPLMYTVFYGLYIHKHNTYVNAYAY